MHVPLTAAAHDCFAPSDLAEPTIGLATEQRQRSGLGCCEPRHRFLPPATVRTASRDKRRPTFGSSTRLAVDSIDRFPMRMFRTCLAQRGRSGRGPRSEHIGDDARRRPQAFHESVKRFSPAPLRVRARPVIPRWQPPEVIAPLPHRVEHSLTRPPALSRAGVARLAVCVGVALAVARLGVGAAAAAYAHVAGLDRPRLLAGGVPGA